MIKLTPSSIFKKQLCSYVGNMLWREIIYLKPITLLDPSWWEITQETTIIIIIIRPNKIFHKKISELYYGQVAGGSRTRTGDHQGVDAPWPLALTRKPTQQESKDRTMPGFGGELREGKTGTQGCGWTRGGLTLQGMTGRWVKARAANGGAQRNGKRRQTHARGAGRRHVWQRMAGGRYGRRPGGRRFALGEEVGSGWKREGF